MPKSNCSRLFQKQNGEKAFPTEMPAARFWPFWWPAVGGDTLSPVAPILGPERKSDHVMRWRGPGGRRARKLPSDQEENGMMK